MVMSRAAINAAPSNLVAGNPHILNDAGAFADVRPKKKCVTKIIIQVNMAPKADIPSMVRKAPPGEMTMITVASAMPMVDISRACVKWSG